MRRRLTALLALVVMLVTLVASPAFGEGPGQQASCVGQDASTFARNPNKDLGQFISSGAGPDLGPFVSEPRRRSGPAPGYSISKRVDGPS